jgi:hypothetical protein
MFKKSRISEKQAGGEVFVRKVKSSQDVSPLLSLDWRGYSSKGFSKGPSRCLLDRFLIANPFFPLTRPIFRKKARAIEGLRERPLLDWCLIGATNRLRRGGGRNAHRHH